MRAAQPQHATAGVHGARYSAVIEPRNYVSFASYFNAFPAGYWQEHTSQASVQLIVQVSGRCRLSLMRSNAKGNFVEIESRQVDSTEAVFEVPLNRYADGGWVWFDVQSFEEPVEITDARWVDPSPAPQSANSNRLAVAITTFNLPDACIRQLERFAATPDVLECLGAVFLIDQGSKRVRDAAGFDEVATRLGPLLHVIEQPNLGGSGGFSRGMLESLERPDIEYVLLLDDDAFPEPESIRRAVRFADRTNRASIVGGHMLNTSAPTLLHSFGERIFTRSFWWDSCDYFLRNIDLRINSLRSTRELSKRQDVGYNGWWMCLIPTKVISEIGLSMPFFIKWDDAEYGLRAAAAGIPTVSLPGMAAWHVAWDEKDDGLDWQAYHHQHNRWVAALLHSPHRKGGALPLKSLASDFKHLLSMQYTVVELRLLGLRDVLSGPGHLHSEMANRAGEARAAIANATEGQLLAGSIETPAVAPSAKAGKAWASRPVKQGFGLALGAVRGLALQTRKVRRHDTPEIRLPAAEAKWWRLMYVDRALVSSATGQGAWIYQRNRGRFWSLLKDSVQTHARVRRNWNKLARQYRGHAAETTSAERWKLTLGVTSG